MLIDKESVGNGTNTSGKAALTSWTVAEASGWTGICDPAMGPLAVRDSV